MQVNKVETRTYSDSLNLDPSVNFLYNINANGRVDFNSQAATWEDMPLEVIGQIKAYFDQMYYVKNCVNNGTTPRFRRTKPVAETLVPTSVLNEVH